MRIKTKHIFFVVFSQLLFYKCGVYRVPSTQQETFVECEGLIETNGIREIGYISIHDLDTDSIINDSSNVNGEFKFILQPDRIYHIIFSKPGHLEVPLEVDTRGSYRGKYWIGLPIDLPKICSKLDQTGKIEISRIYYNSFKGVFYPDKEYNKKNDNNNLLIRQKHLNCEN